MDDSMRIFSDLKRPFPRMLHFIYKPISATLTKKERKLFINVLLQFLGIGFFNLIHEPSQFFVDPLFRLQKQPIEASKNFDVDHIVQPPKWKAFAASPTHSLTHGSILLILYSSFS
jgi:hypothetical protein